MQNVTEKIKESWGSLAEKASKLAGSLTESSRRKRLAEFIRRLKKIILQCLQVLFY
jgi:hypothetical protein